jgi:hypothetical protein
MNHCGCAALLERVERLEQEQRRLLSMIGATQPSEFTFRGPWFSNAEGAAYVPCKSVNGFYEWKKRHHIVSRANGSVAKADLDRVLRVRRATKRGKHPRTMANLQQGWQRQ